MKRVLMVNDVPSSRLFDMEADIINISKKIKKEGINMNTLYIYKIIGTKNYTADEEHSWFSFSRCFNEAHDSGGHDTFEDDEAETSWHSLFGPDTQIEGFYDCYEESSVLYEIPDTIHVSEIEKDVWQIFDGKVYYNLEDKDGAPAFVNTYGEIIYPQKINFDETTSNTLLAETAKLAE